jgi:hypothetical protein
MFYALESLEYEMNEILFLQLLCFLDIIQRPVIIFKATFRRLISSPFSGKKPAQLDPIDSARPSLRTSEPKQNCIYETTTT